MNRGAERTGRTGGQVLVDQLLVHGAETGFCVPGESYLAVLDALRDVQDSLRLIVCRSEGGAAAMAVGHARASGSPGLLFVTRGPGATNASIGIHTAHQDSIPLIVFVGQVERSFSGREGFQEIDVRAVFGSMSKWATQIEDAHRIPEIIRRAYQVATSGRPGPVVIGLPEDMLVDVVEIADAAPYVPVQPAPPAETVDELARMLAASERPIVVVGGGGWDPSSVARLRIVAERLDIPVASSFRCQDLLSNHSSSYAGEFGFAMPGSLVGRASEADLILVLGARLGEVTTLGYTTPRAPRPAQRLVHIHADPDELGSVYEADLQIAASPPHAVATLASLVDSMPRWTEWTATLRAEYLSAQDPASATADEEYIPIIEELRRVLPLDAMISTGAGNYTIWARRFHQFDSYPSEFAPTSGAMGFGLPAGIGAQLAFPDRQMVVFAGDGCLLMTLEELATAARYALPITVLVFNNGRYGTIRSHQERQYPDRSYGTDLVNPDFSALGRAFGFDSHLVERPEQFPAAIATAMERRGPTLIELRLPASRLPQAD